MSLDIELGNKRLLDVAISLYESRHKDFFDMRQWATKDGFPCCALANYAYRDDLQDFLGLEPERSDGRMRDSIVYVSGIKAGDYVHWGDDVILEWFSVNLRDAASLFATFGACSCECETADQAGDFFKKFVSQR